MNPLRLFLPLAYLAVACGDPPARAAGQDSAPRDSPPAGKPESLPPRYWEPRPIQPPKVKVPRPEAPQPAPDTAAPADSGTASAGATIPADSGDTGRARARPARRAAGGNVVRPFQLTPADSARWPVQTPDPLPGSLLPGTRIVAYYGNPRSTRMGILGRIPPDSMLPRLERTARLWAEADSTRNVMPALHLIATVAQGKPGAGRKYRLRMGAAVIDSVARWAEERGWLLIVDVQIGHSTVAAELEPLVPFLKRPYVHLALDPEFAMKNGGIPGQRIGTLDASDVNTAVRLLAKLVDEEKLPPKVLVVHRFNRRMLTNHDKIELDPRVQVVIDMDGFGESRLKQDAYRFWVVPYPVQYTGFKLFYKNDRKLRFRSDASPWSCPDSIALAVGCGDDGLMTPEQVLQLWPVPLYIQYQ